MSSITLSQMDSLHVVLGAGTVAALSILSYYMTVKRQSNRPPGPRPLPVIGNILDMPRSRYALGWAELGQKYGPVVWLAVPGQKFLILNSIEAARELLEKRGSNYVDRPKWVMAGELMGLGSLTPLSRFNAAWRKHRLLLKHSLSQTVVKKDYSTRLTRKAHQYLNCLLTQPEDFLVDLGRVVAENIVELTYGRRIDDKGRDLVELNFYAMAISLRGMQGYIVDMLPALLEREVQYLPSWLPWMNFKRDAAKWRAEVDEIKQSTLEFAKSSLASR
ncbi:hypothetical protein M407DRAFT_21247 [Tulasnella calospora MUT 4182]|uniref:Cytochrome P450 n=1 Tax=Tulasnella calospora MUT 4182 TaxID=1051891 RepID=A0A0C3QEL4_9AGAM|nr:hypothetical protein M407DRAFT_21247 [Tulasnella calospora MUT 4182]